MPSDLSIFVFLILGLIFAIFLIRIPISIAKSRQVKGSSLTWIKILSWVSLFCGVTWFAALIWALVEPPAPSQAPRDGQNENLAAIEKLGQLKEQGLLTQEEFEQKKAQLLEKI